MEAQRLQFEAMLGRNIGKVVKFIKENFNDLPPGEEADVPGTIWVIQGVGPSNSKPDLNVFFVTRRGMLQQILGKVRGKNGGPFETGLWNNKKIVWTPYVDPAQPAAPVVVETRTVPPGQEDPISYVLITDGMPMATFNDEFNQKRYYQRTTVDGYSDTARTPDGTPMKRETVQYYTAKVEGKTRVKHNGKLYDLVAVSPHEYHLEDDKGEVIKEYDDDTLDKARLEKVGGRRRKSRRVKKRHASRRAKKHTRRSKS